MKIFENLKNKINKLVDPEFVDYDAWIDEAFDPKKGDQSYLSHINGYNVAPNLARIKELSQDENLKFLKWLAVGLQYEKSKQSTDKEHVRFWIKRIYTKEILALKLVLNEEDLIYLIFSLFPEATTTKSMVDPEIIKNLVVEIERNTRDKIGSEALSKSLKHLSQGIYNYYTSFYLNTELKKLKALIDELEYKISGDENSFPDVFIGEDRFQEYANDLLGKFTIDKRLLWAQLHTSIQKISGNKPSSKFLKESKSIIDKIGDEEFLTTIENWFQFIIKLKPEAVNHTSSYSGDYILYEFLSILNMHAIRGYVWLSGHFPSNKMFGILTTLAYSSFVKIPGKGIAAEVVGNACLYIMSEMDEMKAIGQFSIMKQKIKSPKTLVLIDKFIQSTATKLNLSIDEVEDLVVEDYGLENGKTIYKADDYLCTIHLSRPGKSQIIWEDTSGKVYKTEPSHVKQQHADLNKQIKNTLKAINLSSTAQKERIENMLRYEREIPVAYFQKRYLDHPLLSVVINKLIFRLKNESSSILAINMNGNFLSISGEELDVNAFSSLFLWHPVTSGSDEVAEWRTYLMSNEIIQPFKQAFREVYIVTEAERRTNIYSNRMAAHILKQHQYIMLAKIRGWKAQLIGAWDGGDNHICRLALSSYSIMAEFWVESLNIQEAVNEAGIYTYVSTDQVRFVNITNGEQIPMDQVPEIPFSEVMRDIDLFVGVASIGNDPNWMDSGEVRQFDNYWSNYSFGELTSSAKERKEMLKLILPKLKLAKHAKIEGNFLVVTGTLKTYKIHIGSTNILMLPNDQYLCIVADRSPKTMKEPLFLPFEGDTGLSLILSKALLLMEDDKIKDETILQQIRSE